jgi:hypothetical protein
MPLFLKSELVQRIKRASAAEIAYRVQKKLTARKLKSALKQTGFAFSVPPVEPAHIAALKMPGVRVLAGGDTIQRLVRGETFGLNTDPEVVAKFEERHRNDFFDAVKPLLDDPDIRTVWEPARLQHAGLLLSCGPDDGEVRQVGKEIVLRWIEANPFLRGPHYMSAMECGLRVPVFFYCLKAAPDLSGEERETLLRAVYEQGWWIEKNLSLYASLGNHTVCECAGLVFAGAIFSGTAEGAHWLRRALALLMHESGHQILEDGGPAEQSFAYHRFVLDLYTLVISFLEASQLFDCESLKQRVLAGERFLRAFEGSDGELPPIGDADGGHAFSPFSHPVRFSADPPLEKARTFAESGYTTIRGEGGMVLTFDHGPLGMAPLFNHGHADALSVTLMHDWKPILVDPGTYRYNGVPDWRRYFKGTRAHNTVTVDGQDQAVQATGFIWTKPYRASLSRIEKGDAWVLLTAWHDGYRRLSESVTHERTLFLHEESKLLIKDNFKGKGYHDFELNYHLHPEAVVDSHDGWFIVQVAGVKAFFKIIENGSTEIVTGSENPIHGWYSPAYGIKISAPVLSCRTRKQTDEAGFTTVVSLGGPCDVNELINRFRQIEQQTANS